MKYGASDLHTQGSEIRIVEADGAVVFEHNAWRRHGTVWQASSQRGARCGFCWRAVGRPSEVLATRSCC